MEKKRAEGLIEEMVEEGEIAFEKMKQMIFGYPEEILQEKISELKQRNMIILPEATSPQGPSEAYTVYIRRVFDEIEFDSSPQVIINILED